MKRVSPSIWKDLESEYRSKVVYYWLGYPLNFVQEETAAGNFELQHRGGPAFSYSCIQRAKLLICNPVVFRKYISKKP